MKKFQYQTLRYMPDRLNGEFINLGVIVLSLESGALFSRFYTRTTRLHQFFPEVNSWFVIRTVKNMEASFQTLRKHIQDSLLFKEVHSLEELSGRVLPKDDSSLFFTDVKMVLDLDGTTLLESLYERQVTQHIQDEDRTSIQDNEVWTKIYKPYFEKASFASKLEGAVVHTKHDEMHFDKTCRNGALHCFEPVSFNLLNSENVRRKVYTWVGKFQELETSKEPLHIYLLAAMPADAKLKKLLKDKFHKKVIGTATIELVDENHVAQVVENVEKLMAEHE